jgi:hypothetical protein
MVLLVKSVKHFKCLEVFVALLFLPIAACLSSAQDAPSFPRPPTKQGCEQFRSSYGRYLAVLRDQASGCHRRHWPEIASDQRVRIACSPIGWPRTCAAEIEKSSCAHDQFGKLLNQCFREAREVTNDPSRQVLLGTTAGVPSSATRNAIRLAGLLIKTGKSDEAKMLLEIGQLAKYQKEFKRIKELHDPAATPMKKIEALVSLGGSSIRNPLAKEMLETAIRGLTKAHQVALDDLTTELAKISANIRRIEDEATARAHNAKIEEQDRAVAAAQQAREQARQSAASQSQGEGEDHEYPPEAFSTPGQGRGYYTPAPKSRLDTCRNLAAYLSCANPRCPGNPEACWYRCDGEGTCR